MRSFKLRTGNNKAYLINKNEFELKTGQKQPYYTVDEKGIKRQFAVCPACDNPIQIIGLYKELKNTDKPYGKHYMSDVKGLAYYNEQAYRYCPYSNNKVTVTANSRKEKLTDLEKSIYYTLRDNFDRVIYFLSKVLDMRISYAKAEEMLYKFVNVEGWMYSWATIANLPYVFAHLTWSKSLYGQFILVNSDLYRNLKEHKNVRLEKVEGIDDYERLLSAPNSYVDIEFCVIVHERKLVDDQLDETMMMYVTDCITGETLYTKQLVIKENRFLNLISKESEYRNQRLLELAKRLMPDLR